MTPGPAFPSTTGGKGAKGGYLPNTDITSCQMSDGTNYSVLSPLGTGSSVLPPPGLALLCCPEEVLAPPPRATASEGQGPLTCSHDSGASSPNCCRWRWARGKGRIPHTHATSQQTSGLASPLALSPSGLANPRPCHLGQLYCAVQEKCRANSPKLWQEMGPAFQSTTSNERQSQLCTSPEHFCGAVGCPNQGHPRVL